MTSFPNAFQYLVLWSWLFETTQRQNWPVNCRVEEGSGYDL